jgi:hypothetical protein
MPLHPPGGALANEQLTGVLLPGRCTPRYAETGASMKNT